MDDINFSIAPPEPEKVDLSSFAPELNKTKAPFAADRNRAATLALLSGQDAVSSYQGMLGGMDVENIKAPIMEKAASGDMQGILSVMSDKSIPLDQKEAAIQAIKKSSLLSDPSTLLHSKALESESKGENIYNEQARLNLSNAIRDSADARQRVQGIVNAHTASLNPDTFTALSEIAEVAVVPFATSVAASKLSGKLNPAQNWWDVVKSAAAPGSVIADERRRYNNLPPEKQVLYVQNLKRLLENNSGLVISSENQYSSFQLMEAITGDYSTFDKFVDNAAPWLDIIGVGTLLGTGLKAVTKTTKATETATKTVATTAPVAPAITTKLPTPTSEVSKLSQSPLVSQNGTLIAQLEAQKAELLGIAGNTAERGVVRNLEKELSALKAPPTVAEIKAEYAKNKQIVSADRVKAEHADLMAEYTAKRTRLENMMETNRQASTTVQEVADLEKQIASLKKSDVMVEAKLNPIAEAIDRVQLNNTIRFENPASPAKIIQQSNPGQARVMHSTVLTSQDDNVAQALYGTSKVDALASDILPQIGVNGKVTSRSFDIEKDIRSQLILDKRVSELLGMRGALEIQPAERAAIYAHVQNDFKSASGLTFNPSMSAFELDGANIKVTGLYGTPDGAFRHAEDAVEQAVFALRDYGIKLEDLIIYKKEGLDHVPVSLDSVRGVEGNYLVGIKTSVPMSLNDIYKIPDVAIEHLDVKKNWADRFSSLNWGQQGSLARMIADPGTMLHQSLAGAAVANSDLAAKADKMLLTVLEDFTRPFNKLDKASRTKLMEYFKDANNNNIKFDPVNLLMNGWTGAEVDVARNWKKYWDSVYYLENHDLVSTLNHQGYQFLHNTFAELYAKPLSKNRELAGKKMYNTSTDNVVDMTRDEIDQLYTRGGTIAQLRRPADIAGDTVEYAIVWNSNQSYLRKVRDSDAVLNYRDGYFQLQYKAPKFIDKVLEVDKQGNATKVKTVAVAGDTAEAEAFKKRMMQNTGDKYVVRGDNRIFRTGSDEHWDIASASGRIAQRHRGKLLEDASGPNHLGNGSYILNPVDSAVVAARSIAGRVVGRPMLENMKTRAMEQYGHMFPSNGMGGKLWPQVSDIKASGQFTTKELGQARTTIEYINYLENGYTNGIDVGFRYFFNYLGEVASKVGMSKLERGANMVAASNAGPGAFHKSFVFYASIAWSPIRQLVLQPHQAIRTFAFNPIGWGNGNIVKLHYGYLKDKAGIKGDKYVQDFVHFLDNSGSIQAIDKQNLVRGTITDAAGSTNAVVKNLGRLAIAPRKIGFDLGELINTVSHYAAVYEQYARNGANVRDKTVMQEMVSKARALSYDMNSAGDMPYNQNFASMIMQFLQIPHKAILNYTTRRLTGQEKARLFIADTVFWGVPGSVVISNFMGDVLPEDPTARAIVVDGLESFAFNSLADRVLGDGDGKYPKIDFSSLAPADMQGWSKTIHAFMTGGPEAAFLNSPSGSLIYKEGSRVRTAFSTLAKFFTYSEDEDGPSSRQAMDSFLSISSGYANWIKAKVLLEEHKRLTAVGRVQEDGLDQFAAWMQLAGFGGKSVKDLFEVSEAANAASKSYKEDVLKTYRDVVRMYVAESHKELPNVEQMIRVQNKLFKAYEGQPEAIRIIRAQLEKDIVDPQTQLMATLMKLIMIPDMKSRRDLIKRAPISEEQKQTYYDLLEQFQANVRKE